MIDDLAVQSTSGSSGMTLQTFANLTNVSNHQLVNTSGYPNDWQYVTWEGHNGPWHTSDSLKPSKLCQRLAHRPRTRNHTMGNWRNRQFWRLWTKQYSLALAAIVEWA